MSPNAKYNVSFHQATTLYWYCRPGGHGICVTLYLTFDKYESGVGAYIFINNCISRRAFLKAGKLSMLPKKRTIL